MDLVFHIPQLHKFIARTETIRPLNPAKITFSSSDIDIILGPLVSVVQLKITCREPDRQAASMAQLNVREFTCGQARQGNGIDPTLWFELFNPFPSVQRLHIHDELRPLVARALQELTGDRATEVLPTLHSLTFKGQSKSGSIREDIQAFITARQHSDRPVDARWK
ncbi:hypothetical protein BJV74DRAFT_989917 [Russula compacta]|nr:hypothetical protein BJV74DRAFT_989917 [Russula compacta]